MKKLMLLPLFAVLLTPCLSAQEKPHDGYWWKSLDESRQLFYIAGYIDGVETGRFQLGWISDKGNPNEQTKAALKVSNQFIDFSKISVGQLRNGVVSFYADYRNQNVDMISALTYCRSQIKGFPTQDELDRWLEGKRREAGHSTSEKHN